MAKRWSEEELRFLQEHWGNKSVKSIAQNLNRSTNAVIIKAQKLHLGAFLDSGDYVTLNTIWKTLKISDGGKQYKNTSWIKNRNFPVKYQKVNNNKFRIVKLKDFWKWAKNNQDILDFSNFEKYALGGEPLWVDKKRSADKLKKSLIINTYWTKNDDERLKHMLESKRYTTSEIAKALKRSEGAIIRRISTLGLKINPLRNNAHNSKWTAEEIEILTKKIENGTNYTVLSFYIPKHSEKAIRGKVYLLYGTEKLDIVRKFLMEGPVK